MRLLAARWTLETAGLLTFERRLGALSQDPENVQWAKRMIEVEMRC